MTNFEKIKSMSIKELSQFLWQFDLNEVARDGEYFISRTKLLEWLQSPTTESNIKEN